MAEGNLDGPYVQVAAICTTPLIEQGGGLSIIRIQDRIQLAGTTDTMQPQPLHSLFLVLALKSGGTTGKFSLTIVPIDPNGKEIQGFPTFTVLFEGMERGQVIAFPLPLVAAEEGLYWFEVKLEGALVTKIPLRVMYQKLQLPPGMAFSPPSAG